MGCDAISVFKWSHTVESRTDALCWLLERKLNGERNPKGTEQQIQPSANCCMNQPSNIVLLDTTAVSLCISHCQRHRGEKKPTKTMGRKQQWLLLFTSAINVHQNFLHLYDISPSSSQRDWAFCEGCHSTNVNCLRGRGLNNSDEERQGQRRGTSPREWSLLLLMWRGIWSLLDLFTPEIREKKITFQAAIST